MSNEVSRRVFLSIPPMAAIVGGGNQVSQAQRFWDAAVEVFGAERVKDAANEESCWKAAPGEVGVRIGKVGLWAKEADLAGLSDEGLRDVLIKNGKKKRLL